MTAWGVTAPPCLGMLYDYDVMGRTTQRYEYQTSNCSAGHPVQNTYDLMGNILTQTDGQWDTTVYTYNPAARLLTATEYGANGGTDNLLSNAHYDAFGHLVSDTTVYGELESYTYDKRGRQVTSNTTYNGYPVYSFDITSFAPNGNVLAANDSSNGNWTYSYDQFNRLTGSNQNSGAAVYSYVYDRFGNRWQQNGPLSFSATFTGNNPSAPANNNRIDGYTYDAAGNVINDGTHSYTYDAENRLISVDNGNTSTYTYDGEGRRFSKTNSSSINSGGGPPDPTGTNEFVYDAQGRLVHTENSIGNGWRTEVWAGSRHLATYFGPDPVLHHTDWLGTERDYDFPNSNAPQYPWNTNFTSLPFGDDSPGVDAGLNSLLFTGQYHDFETDLDYFGARYYASAQGRFTSPDDGDGPDSPGSPQSLDLYGYVENNPTNAVDPDGHDCVFTQGNYAYVRTGDCSGISNGTYVPGTVDPHSGSYDPNTHTLSVNYTPYGNGPNDPKGLAIVANVYPTHPGLSESEKFASRMAIGADNVNAFAVQVGLQVGGEIIGRVGVAGIQAFRAAREVTAAAEAAVDFQNVSSKISRQMLSRGWTKQAIVDTIKEAQEGGTAYPALNKATGGAATEYVSQSTGKFVVIDNATKKIIQVSGPGFKPNYMAKP